MPGGPCAHNVRCTQSAATWALPQLRRATTDIMERKTEQALTIAKFTAYAGVLAASV